MVWLVDNTVDISDDCIVLLPFTASNVTWNNSDLSIGDRQLPFLCYTVSSRLLSYTALF